jgi:hypothetical protein
VNWLWLWITAAVSIAACVFLAWWTRLVITIEYSHCREDHQLRIRCRALYGIIRWHKQIRSDQDGPQARAGSEGVRGREHDELALNAGAIRVLRLWSGLKDVSETARQLREACVTIHGLLRRATFRDCEIRLCIGTGDVASSGVACGVTWAALGTFLGWLSHLSRFPHPPSIRIQPDYSQRQLSAEVRCIVEIPAGHAIVAGLRLMRAWRRRMADGTSYPRLDANRHEQYS